MPRTNIKKRLEEAEDISLAIHALADRIDNFAIGFPYQETINDDERAMKLLAEKVVDCVKDGDVLWGLLTRLARVANKPEVKRINKRNERTI